MTLPTPNPAVRCFRCGHQATAELAGVAGTLAVCGCTLDALGALLASSINVRPGSNQLGAYEHALDIFHAGFWRGAAGRAFDAAEPFPPEPEPSPDVVPAGL